MLTADVTSATNSSQTAFGASEAGLGQEDFLRMLIAQLENQDPLNPQESTEFTAQLAQFSSLEQEIAMRESLESMSKAMGRTDSVTAIGMIGQTVLAEGAEFELGQNGATLQFELAGSSTATEINVLDENGRHVDTLQAGPLPGGLHAVPWDGMTSNDTPAPPGIYELEVVAENTGDPIDATALIRARVTGADVTGHQPMLLLGQMLLPLSSVREVHANPAGAAQP